MPIWTAGHSNISQSDFVNLITGVDVLVDIRSHPGSKWPQFQHENLGAYLPSSGIRYEWWPDLGGWTSKHLDVADEFTKFGVNVRAYSGQKFPKGQIAQDITRDSTKPYWNNRGLYEYSFFMMLPEFMQGCKELLRRSQSETLCIMCCEALPWKCHRSMVADYLLWKGEDCLHAMPRWRQKNKVRFVAGAKLTPHSKMLGNRLERYDPAIREAWDKFEV